MSRAYHVLVYLALVLYMAAAQEPSSPLTIQEVRAIVTRNTSLIVDLQYDYAKTFISTTDSQPSDKSDSTQSETSPKITRGHWASTKSGKFLKEFHSSAEIGAPLPTRSTAYAFNGKDLRVVQIDPEGKEYGQITNAQEAKLQFDRSGHETEVNRANGLNVAGRSLQEWIGLDDAQLLPEEKLGEATCCVIYVPKGGTGKHQTYDGLKFYLDKNKSCAIASLCYMSGQTVIARSVNTEFLEVSPGFWFAVKGYRDPVGVLTYDAKPLPVVNFEVSNLAVNKQIPDEVFEPTFKKGTEVRDNRAGFPVTYVWGDGQGIPKKVLESLGDVADAHDNVESPSIKQDLHSAIPPVSVNAEKENPESLMLPALVLTVVVVAIMIAVMLLRWRTKPKPELGESDTRA